MATSTVSREALAIPSPGDKFCKSEVEKVIQEVCKELIGENSRYVPEEVQSFIKDIGNEIQQRVVRLGYERYKLVTHCVVTEAANQGLRVCSRCLWDPEADNYARFTFSNQYMHVNVVVFGIYWG
ncbi:unnamed protein product [Phytomonas sp. EM1]|nr:unnamed protein product [Phytomonas sp. EM1]|eukprot:CCW62374.1 unnamed protein product [Phytomonas sp. isolate EM1]